MYPQTAPDAIDVRRLRRFTDAMLPIAAAYDAVFVAGAIAWRSVALAGGAFSVAVYVLALAWARRALARGAVGRAALVTGGALLAMVAIGAVFLHFQLAALIVIAVAAVVVVLPHVSQRTLLRFAAIALLVIVQILAFDEMLPAAFDEPPLWFQRAVLGTAVIAAAVLVVVMLSSDHERMRASVTASLAGAAQAEHARAATETFLVAAAHQLRTPIGTVLLQSETALADAAVDDRMRARLERVVRQAVRLQHVVDAMLDVSRASAGTLQLEHAPLDLAAVVRDVAGRHARDAADAGVTVHVDAPARLPWEGDPQRLALVTSNLVDNAIKFGGGSPAHVALHERELHAELCVSDAGAGMSADARARCFDRDAPSSRTDGSLGVGLWLTRQLVRAMGGDVAAEDNRPRGTKFVVRIPRRPA